MGSPTFSFAIALVLVETGFLITERVFEGMLMAQYYRDGAKKRALGCVTSPM